MDISGNAPVCRLAGRNLVNCISAGVVRNDTRRLHEKMRLIDADSIKYRLGVDDDDRQMFFVYAKDIKQMPALDENALIKLIE